MYSKDFVVVIIVDGKVVDGDKAGVVALPFGTEYKIRLRNKHNRRAVAKVFIDDENVAEDGIVVPANDYVDLERPTTKAVKFKFVSADSEAAADFGKNNKTDGSNGVIRIEWRLEKERTQYVQPVVPMPIPVPYPYPVYRPTWNYRYDNDPMYGQLKSVSRESSGGTFSNFTPAGGACGQSMNAGACDFEPVETPTSATPRGLKEGCTVEGGWSSQNFRTVHIDLEDGAPVVIQLILKGLDKETMKAVSDNKFCGNCGLQASKRDNFCSNCGKSFKLRRKHV